MTTEFRTPAEWTAYRQGLMDAHTAVREAAQAGPAGHGGPARILGRLSTQFWRTSGWSEALLEIGNRLLESYTIAYAREMAGAARDNPPSAPSTPVPAPIR